MGTVIQDVTLDTTGAWVTIASTKFYSEFAKLLIHIYETVGTNSFAYRVQGANNVDFDGAETLADSVGTAQWTVAASGSDFDSTFYLDNPVDRDMFFYHVETNPCRGHDVGGGQGGIGLHYLRV